MRIDVPVDLTTPLVGIEWKLKHFGGIGGRGFKFPFADRVSGRFEQHRISALSVPDGLSSEPVRPAWTHGTDCQSNQQAACLTHWEWTVSSFTLVAGAASGKCLK